MKGSVQNQVNRDYRVFDSIMALLILAWNEIFTVDIYAKNRLNILNYFFFEKAPFHIGMSCKRS